MSEIDPAALSRPDPVSRASETPAPASKSLPNGTNATSKAAKAPPAAPRVDLEPFYTEIKAQIGENWSTYKDSISRFVLGGLNQAELSTTVEPFIFVDPKRENLHNQLICGLYANILREPPDATVASWVSANDKPTTAPKPASGDVAEQRLKHEIMRLPPRMRQRIKGVRDDPHKPLTTTLLTTARSLSFHPHTHPHQPPHPTSTTDIGAGTTSTATTLNRDAEIRRRYNLPLISELHDLPPTISALSDRITPIAYEQGLASGVGQSERLAGLLGTALGIFVKDVFGMWLGGTRADLCCSEPPLGVGVEGVQQVQQQGEAGGQGAGWGGLDRGGVGVKTGAFKRRLAEEEEAWASGEVKRSEGGLFPVEVENSREVGKGKGARGDMRVLWDMGEERLRGMVPWWGERVGLLDWGDGGEEGGQEMEVEDGDGRRGGGVDGGVVVVNGVNGVNSINGHAHDDPMHLDEDWGWPGAKIADAKRLDALLDECLEF